MNTVLEKYLKVFTSSLEFSALGSPKEDYACLSAFLHAAAVGGVQFGQIETILKGMDDDQDGYLSRVQLYNVNYTRNE